MAKHGNGTVGQFRSKWPDIIDERAAVYAEGHGEGSDPRNLLWRLEPRTILRTQKNPTASYPPLVSNCLPSLVGNPLQRPL